MIDKHTQGEWEIQWYKGDFDIPTKIVVNTKMNGGIYSETICDILHGAKDDDDYLANHKERTEADAKLIVAAPDLLELAYYMEGVMDHLSGRMGEQMEIEVNDAIESAIKNATQ